MGLLGLQGASQEGRPLMRTFNVQLRVDEGWLEWIQSGRQHVEDDEVFELVSIALEVRVGFHEIQRTCERCGKTKSIEVETARYYAWERGLSIQAAFPDLSPPEREEIMTGYCPACWDAEFKPKPPVERVPTKGD